jgi:hypothetical protein
VRTRTGEDLGAIPVGEVVDMLTKQVADKSWIDSQHG